MKTVTVIAAMGATVRGPARLELSKEQAARRLHLLLPAKGGAFEVDGGREVQFKAGESFGIATPEKLSRAVFDWPESSGRKKAAGAKNGTEGDGDPPPSDGGTGEEART